VVELIEEVPGGLDQYRPRLRYCLLDEERIADSELESLQNLAAALFRLEKSEGPEDIQRVLVALIEWLREPGLGELRRSFTSWLIAVLLPGRVPGITIPQVADLQEVKSMLAERVVEWTEKWKQEGLQEGLQEGQQKEFDRFRRVFLRGLEERFGPLPAEVRQRVEAISSSEELAELGLRIGSASSIAALGLG